MSTPRERNTAPRSQSVPRCHLRDNVANQLSVTYNTELMETIVGSERIPKIVKSKKWRNPASSAPGLESIYVPPHCLPASRKGGGVWPDGMVDIITKAAWLFSCLRQGKELVVFPEMARLLTLFPSLPPFGNEDVEATTCNDD